MGDLSTGPSSYPEALDTRTPQTPFVSRIKELHMAGLFSAIQALETALGIRKRFADTQSLTRLYTLPDQDATLATLAGAETLTNKRLTARLVAVADGTTFTPTGDTADQNTQANTQATGTLTMAAPTGTPTDGQKLILRVTSTNVQTFAWHAIYRGSVDLPLPTASSGATKTDYLGFIYHSPDSKWDLVAKVFRF